MMYYGGVVPFLYNHKYCMHKIHQNKNVDVIMYITMQYSNVYKRFYHMSPVSKITSHALRGLHSYIPWGYTKPVVLYRKHIVIHTRCTVT